MQIPRWTPLLCGALGALALQVHAQTTPPDAPIQRILVIGRAGGDDSSPAVVRCLQPVAGPPACIYPLDGADTVVLTPNGNLLKSPEERAKWLAGELSTLTIYLNPNTLPVTAGVLEASKPVRLQYVTNLQLKFKPKLAEALKLRDTVRDVLEQKLEVGGRIKGMDLGVPILQRLAPAATGTPAVSVEQRLQKLLPDPNTPPPVAAPVAVLSPLEKSLNAPAVRRALIEFLTRNGFDSGRAASEQKIAALRDSKVEPAALDQNTLLTSYSFWLAVGLGLVVLIVAASLLGAYLVPGPVIARREAVRALERVGGLGREASKLNELLNQARKSGQYDTLQRHIQNSQIWLLAAGGYARALDLLRGSVSSTASFPAATAPELENLAFIRVRDIDQLKNKLLEARSTYQQQLNLEQSTLTRKLNESEARLQEVTELHALRVRQTQKLLSKVFADHESVRAAEAFLANRAENVPLPVIAEFERLRANSHALDEVGRELQGFASTNDAGWSWSGSDAVLQRARSANRVAVSLHTMVTENALSVPRDDAVLRATAIEDELRKSKVERDYNRKTASDYAGTRALLQEAVKINIATETSTLRDLVVTLLGKLGAAAQKIKGQDEMMDGLRRSQERTVAELADARTACQLTASELQNAAATLSGVLEKFAGVGARQADELGLREPRAQTLDYLKVRQFAAGFDARLIALKFAADALASEIAALQAINRNDLVEALYLPRIAVGLADLQARCLCVQRRSNAGEPEKEALFRLIYLPCLQEGWLHLLLRADCLGAPYCRGNEDLQSLRRIVAIAATLAEQMLADTSTKVVRPVLLTAPTGNVRTRTGAEARLKALPEVKRELAPYIERGEVVVVDVFEIGIESSFASYQPSVVTLNPAEWRS